MKHVFMLFAMVFMASVQPMSAQSTCSASDPNDPDVHIIIKLEGETEDDRNKSQVLPYVARQDGKTITVTSYSDVTSVTYTILSPSGAAVDSYTGPVSQMQAVTLSAAGLEEGEYTLLITTPGGTYVYGTFSL